MNSTQVNIFYLETELQCLAYKNILVSLSADSANIVFTTLQSVYEHLIGIDQPVLFLDKKVRGWFSRLIRFRANLKVIRKAIEKENPSPVEINYHTARIDGFFPNLIIGYLKYHFPQTVIHTRLIPDGAINVFSSEISESKKRKLRRWSKDWAVRIFRDMSIVPIHGDELGADVSVVDRIYCFDGVNTPYPQAKLSRVAMLNSKEGYKEKREKSRALIIGQNFLQLGTASPQFVEAVSRKIRRLLELNNIEDVDYISHPRSECKEFWDVHYNWLERSELCSEELVATGKYSHVISCYSSVLLNSKLILGESINVFSVGVEAFPFQDQRQLDQIKTVYNQAGINFFQLEEADEKSN